MHAARIYIKHWVMLPKQSNTVRSFWSGFLCKGYPYICICLYGCQRARYSCLEKSLTKNERVDSVRTFNVYNTILQIASSDAFSRSAQPNSWTSSLASQQIRICVVLHTFLAFDNFDLKMLIKITNEWINQWHSEHLWLIKMMNQVPYKILLRLNFC